MMSIRVPSLLARLSTAPSPSLVNNATDDSYPLSMDLGRQRDFLCFFLPFLQSSMGLCLAEPMLNN